MPVSSYLFEQVSVLHVRISYHIFQCYQVVSKADDSKQLKGHQKKEMTPAVWSQSAEDLGKNRKIMIAESALPLWER